MVDVVLELQYIIIAHSVGAMIPLMMSGLEDGGMVLVVLELQLCFQCPGDQQGANRQSATHQND